MHHCAQPIQSPGLDLSTLSNHLASARRAWLIDWSQDGALAALFEGTYTGIPNLNPVTIENDSLADGVENPLPLQNPGWNTWSWAITPTGDAESVARYDNGNSALVWGNEGRSALIGFTADSVSESNAQRFFENLLAFLQGHPAARWIDAPNIWKSQN